MVQMIKNLPAMQVQYLGWEDPLEKGMVTHSSILASSVHPTDRGAWWATVHVVAESDMAVQLMHTCLKQLIRPCKTQGRDKDAFLLMFTWPV